MDQTADDILSRVQKMIFAHTRGADRPSAVVLSARDWDALFHGMREKAPGGVFTAPHEPRQNFVIAGIPIVAGGAESVEIN